MKSRSFLFYCDPGHGWMKVRLAEIKKLGVQDKISGCSYVRGEHAYLEEDCDASVFLAALKAKHVPITLKSSHGDKSSKIRNYASYNHERIDWARV